MYSFIPRKSIYIFHHIHLGRFYFSHTRYLRYSTDTPYAAHCPALHRKNHTHIQSPSFLSDASCLRHKAHTASRVRQTSNLFHILFQALLLWLHTRSHQALYLLCQTGAINLECQTTIYPIKTTEILFFVVQKIIYSFNWKSVFNVNYFKQI